jgi:GrpB-like predicted nucleotidyltransferase (UPF0157 family)
MSRRIVPFFWCDGAGTGKPATDTITGMRPLPPLPAVTAPLTEDALAALIVDGPPQRLSGRIEIHDYDPRWPEQYAREAGRIRTALGDSVLALEHVGSTSVPGLAAKPRIDIDLIVADTTDEDAYVPALEAAGYVLHVREPDWYQHRLFHSRDSRVNLHVFAPGCDEHARHLVFRDWLRTHPGDRDRYEAVKRDLATRTWTYTNQYADAKRDIVVDILTLAGCRPVTEAEAV